MYRSSPHATTGVPPCSLFLKRQIRTRFDLLKPDQESHVMEKQSQQMTDHDRNSRSRQFEVGQSVMANLRPGPKWIHRVIVQQLGPLSFLVKTRDGQTWRRHVDHLKRVHTEQEFRGRSENSNTEIENWELPNTRHSSTPTPETMDPTSPEDSDPNPDPEQVDADELPNDSEAEPSAGESNSRRYPTRNRQPLTTSELHWVCDLYHLFLI